MINHGNPGKKIGHVPSLVRPSKIRGSSTMHLSSGGNASAEVSAVGQTIISTSKPQASSIGEQENPAIPTPKAV
jgi:hypothetical protein